MSRERLCYAIGTNKTCPRALAPDLLFCDPGYFGPSGNRQKIANVVSDLPRAAIARRLKWHLQPCSRLRDPQRAELVDHRGRALHRDQPNGTVHTRQDKWTGLSLASDVSLEVGQKIANEHGGRSRREICLQHAQAIHGPPTSAVRREVLENRQVDHEPVGMKHDAVRILAVEAMRSRREDVKLNRLPRAREKYLAITVLRRGPVNGGGLALALHRADPRKSL